MSTSPRVTAPAMAYVPASIRSGTTVWDAPWSASTPSISIVSVPSPEMRAPIARRSRARSTTSGSRAALTRRVAPRASVAASMAFSVPVTVTPWKAISAPDSFAARAST